MIDPVFRHPATHNSEYPATLHLAQIFPFDRNFGHSQDVV